MCIKLQATQKSQALPVLHRGTGKPDSLVYSSLNFLYPLEMPLHKPSVSNTKSSVAGGKETHHFLS